MESNKGLLLFVVFELAIIIIMLYKAGQQAQQYAAQVQQAAATAQASPLGSVVGTLFGG